LLVSCACARRLLHSFPTRRSSDLKERTLSVNIPAGVEDGTRIRLAGEGEAGLRGGPSGDLYIFLSITPHAFFQRDGADIFCRVRSEEHTSELQSRENLVCRLLLAK